MQAELLKLEDSVREVYEEMLYMRQREEEMRNTNGLFSLLLLSTDTAMELTHPYVCNPESTNSRVMWYSVFTIVVLLSLGAAQVWILRRDFKAKKLIY